MEVTAALLTRLVMASVIPLTLIECANMMKKIVPVTTNQLQMTNVT